jgi:electron transport complex protein RnfA
MADLFSIFLTSVFVNNLMLRQFLGVSPYTLLCGSVRSALAMGAAMTVVLTSSSIASWYLHRYVLQPFGAEYLYILAFVLVILLAAYCTELLLKKALPSVYSSADAFLPSIGTNCAVLGLVILNLRKGYGLTETIVHSIGAALGLTLALVLIAGIMERLKLNGESRYFQGIPHALIIASILSIIFQLLVF